MMNAIANWVREWIKLPPSQKITTYLLVGAIVSIVATVRMYNRQLAIYEDTRDELKGCRSDNKQLENDFRTYLIQEKQEKQQLNDSLKQISSTK